MTARCRSVQAGLDSDLAAPRARGSASRYHPGRRAARCFTKVLVACSLFAFASAAHFPSAMPLSTNGAGHTYRPLKTFQVHACRDQELLMECPSNSVISVLLANYEVRRPEDVAGTRVHSAPGSDASPTMVAADKIGSQAQGSQRQRELMCVRRIRSGSEHILARQDGEGPASSAFSTSSSSSSASSEKASVSFPARRQLNDTPPADDSTRNSGNCTSFSVNVAGIIQAHCRSKRVCTFNASESEAIAKINVCSGAASHGLLEYVELAYKCKPLTTSTRLICEGERLELACQRSSRLVVYSAHFGPALDTMDRSTLPAANCRRPAPQSDPASWPPADKREEAPPPLQPLCALIPVTDTIIRACHGRKRCALEASRRVLGAGLLSLNTSCHQKDDELISGRAFGRALQRANRLKVQYTCAPKSIFQEQLRLDAAEEQIDNSGDSVEFTQRPAASMPPASSVIHRTPKHRAGSDERERRVAFRPSSRQNAADAAGGGATGAVANNNNSNCTTYLTQPSPEPRSLGIFGDWLSAYVFITRNLERLALYLLVSIFGSLLAFFAVLSCRLYLSKRRALKRVHDDAPLCPPLAVMIEDDRETSQGDPLVSRASHSDSRRPSTLFTQNGAHNGHRQQVMSTGHYSVPSVRYATLANFRTPSDEAASPSPRDGAQTRGSRGTTPSRSTNASVVYTHSP